jgi:hypothetical protein
MHGFTEEDLILYLYKEISAEQSMLLEEAMRLAEEMEAAGVASGQPSVDVR